MVAIYVFVRVRCKVASCRRRACRIRCRGAWQGARARGRTRARQAATAMTGRRRRATATSRAREGGGRGQIGGGVLTQAGEEQIGARTTVSCGCGGRQRPQIEEEAEVREGTQALSLLVWIRSSSCSFSWSSDSGVATPWRRRRGTPPAKRCGALGWKKRSREGEEGWRREEEEEGDGARVRWERGAAGAGFKEEPVARWLRWRRKRRGGAMALATYT